MNRLFTRFANATARATGRSWAFLLCVLVVLVWAATGPIFHFNETWQLVINTGTTIVTFLMVFLIQNTQNREGAAMQAKLDELIRVTTRAENEYIGIEHLTDTELEVILQRCELQAKDNRRLLVRAHQEAKGAKKEADEAKKEADEAKGEARAARETSEAVAKGRAPRKAAEPKAAARR